jgi:hypothetical protein
MAPMPYAPSTRSRVVTGNAAGAASNGHCRFALLPMMRTQQILLNASRAAVAETVLFFSCTDYTIKTVENISIELDKYKRRP